MLRFIFKDTHLINGLKTIEIISPALERILKDGLPNQSFPYPIEFIGIEIVENNPIMLDIEIQEKKDA